MDSFAKVIGYEAEKLELRRYCDFLKNTEKYKSLGVSLPKGILLYGEPGIGKTLMAMCFIEECGIKSFVVRKEFSDGEFVNHIKNIFKEARESAPSIILLDDMDKFSNGDSEHKNTEEFVVIQACIDECKNDDIFVIATVNNRWSLPDSLTRKGRFDKEIGMNMPDDEDAVKIIKHYLNQKKILDEVDAEEIGRVLRGYSCSDLETIINEAGVYAAFEGKSAIDRISMMKACCRVVFEEEYAIEKDSNYIDNIDCRRIAIHEAGHTVAGEVLRKGSVSFVALGNVNGIIKGITITKGYPRNEDTKRNTEIDIIIALAGRVATELLTGELDIGTFDDLQQAYNDTYRLVAAVGSTGLSIHNCISDLSDTMKRDIEVATNVEINRYYEEARRIIMENQDFLEKIIQLLLENKYLTYKDIERIAS